MEPVAAHYKPSLLNPSKYIVYADYFKEYIANGDFKSLGASLKYMFTHKLPKKEFTTKSQMGKFRIRPHTTDFQFINFAYERKIKKYMKSHLDSFDVFIDVGACIGEYCIWLAKLGKQCIAIEPVNSNAVNANVALNNLGDKVKVLPCGLGNKRERVYFNIPYGIPSSSYLDREGNKEPNVDIETFDSIFSTFGIPTTAKVLVKLDVEGMEPEVIEGAAEFIKAYPHLTFIYEHFPSDAYRNDRAISAHGNFEFSDIDPFNRLAIKKN